MRRACSSSYLRITPSSSREKSVVIGSEFDDSRPASPEQAQSQTRRHGEGLETKHGKVDTPMLSSS